MDYTDFIVDRTQHMRPLEYDLSDNFNELVRYLNDMGGLNNIPVGTIGPSEIITASDALSVPLRSLVVGGNSVQDGTPTPDAPVDIVSAENPVLAFTGKNLWADLVPGYVTDSGTIAAPSSTQLEYSTDYIPIASGDVLRLLNLMPTDAQPWIGISLYDASKTFIRRLGYLATQRDVTITDANAAYVRISMRTYGYQDRIIVTKNETPTTVTLPVTLRSLPDGTKDTATYTYLRPSTREGWAWYSGEVTRRCYEHLPSRVTNTGTSGTMPITRIYLPAAGINTTSAYNNLLCNRFAAGSVSQAGHCTVTSNGGLLILSGEMFDTSENANAWIAEHPVTVIYPLATPTTETIDPIELPSVIGPGCTIYATADATPTLTAQYIRDLSAAINDMQEAIADI